MGAVSEAFQEAVMALFPDMCPDHLNELGTRFNFDHEQVIGHVIDQQDLGRQYPKWDKSAKRKRQEVSPVADGPAEKKMKFNSDPARLAGKDSLFLRTYKKAGKILLAAGFPQFYAQDIEDTLNKNGNLVYAAYKALEDNLQNKDGKPKLKLKPRPKANPLDSIFDQSTNEAERMADDEYRAAKAESQKRKEEELHLDRAKAQGLTADCGCCYDEFALDRMVHCNGEVLHWFCPLCAKTQAETQIGLSKYELSCMSTDQCHGGFSLEQRKLFLDEATTIALDRIEKEAVLRLAGIENLAKCPFCLYAAEYPSVQENKEFQCENPACGKRSCRLCDMETHIPKTCREARAEEGHSGRHRIEEAMSEAMIRKCNKCKTPFIKENGCNKMTCTAVGCRNVQCYVCSKSCDYAHFDDTTRGGKKGQCPLFDSVEQRHEDEVRAAELKAREQVAQENPNIDAEAFQFNFSERVKQDEERRKANNPAPAARRAPVVPLMPPDIRRPRLANGRFSLCIRG
ncbi:ring finger protein [Podospora aff. communis PSN243]|uniref:Ring finger protein n=1 Tax=Podospora aff. communis PSN243 TaxID=3040156 RepID=A0AAV9GKQ6_9PEZI|nr:ring finger protein [Podospora aff. communis PSN243]